LQQLETELEAITGSISKRDYIYFRMLLIHGAVQFCIPRTWRGVAAA
jgi:hypothetical protein